MIVKPSVSMKRDLWDRFTKRCAELGVTKSEVVERLLADIGGGSRPRSARRPPTKPSACAICTNRLTHDDGMRFAPLASDGGDVRICQRCDEEHPRAGGYSFTEERATTKISRTRITRGR